MTNLRCDLRSFCCDDSSSLRSATPRPLLKSCCDDDQPCCRSAGYPLRQHFTKSADPLQKNFSLPPFPSRLEILLLRRPVCCKLRPPRCNSRLLRCEIAPPPTPAAPCGRHFSYPLPCCEHLSPVAKSASALAVFPLRTIDDPLQICNTTGCPPAANEHHPRCISNSEDQQRRR